MIIRRISKGIKDQDWFVVMVEVLIVVVGIFIGLQVDDWNSNKENKAREHLLLGYMIEDLNVEISMLERLLENSKKRVAALSAIIEESGEALPDFIYRAKGIEALDNNEIPYKDNPDTNLPSHLFSPIFTLNNSTYLTMLNSAALETIQDPILTRKIQKYYTSIEQRMLFDQRLIYFRNELARVEVLVGTSMIDLMSIPEIAEVAKQNPSILAAMKNYWNFSNNHILLIKKSKEDALTLISEIQIGLAQ